MTNMLLEVYLSMVLIIGEYLEFFKILIVNFKIKFEGLALNLMSIKFYIIIRFNFLLF